MVSPSPILEQDRRRRRRRNWLWTWILRYRKQRMACQCKLPSHSHPNFQLSTETNDEIVRQSRTQRRWRRIERRQCSQYDRHRSGGDIVLSLNEFHLTRLAPDHRDRSGFGQDCQHDDYRHGRHTITISDRFGRLTSRLSSTNQGSGADRPDGREYLLLSSVSA